MKTLTDSLTLSAALAKEAGNDDDMAEMIDFEIESLTKQIKEIEERLKVFESR